MISREAMLKILAVEGRTLSADDQAFLDELEKLTLSPEEFRQRIISYIKKDQKCSPTP